MQVATLIGAGLIAVVICVALALSDASDEKWHIKVGVRALWGLLILDVLSTIVAFVLLLLLSGGIWHGLAASRLVAARSSTDVGTLIMAVVVAGVAGSSVLTFRVPGKANRSLSKRLARERQKRLTRVRQRSLDYQTTDNVSRVVPALQLLAPADRERHLGGWCATRGSSIPSASRSRIVRLCGSDKDADLMAVAVDLQNNGGRDYLEKFLREGKGAGSAGGSSRQTAS